jgi:hypothetical protein
MNYCAIIKYFSIITEAENVPCLLFRVIMCQIVSELKLRALVLDGTSIFGRKQKAIQFISKQCCIVGTSDVNNQSTKCIRSLSFILFN